MQLQQIAVDQLHPSPHNPRKDFPKESLQQLASSIGLHGVQEPLKARPNGKGFELVFGHRRLKAAQLAGLKEVPVLVEKLTDLQVAEAQLAENLDREELSPLEVAAGYQRLLELGQSMDKVCERSGRKRSAIYATLQLLKLSPEAKKAIGEGAIGGSVGQLLAKWVPPSLQGKALEQLNAEGCVTYRDVLKFLVQEYATDLKKASFDVKDAVLYPVAGACVTCKKRTGANPDLFGDDTKVPDLCSDKACFQQKTHLVAKKEADKQGLKLLTPAEAEGIFSYGDTLEYNSPYVRPSDLYFEDHKRRSFEELLEPEQVKSLQVAALSNDGKLVKLLPRAPLKKAMAKAGKMKTWEQLQKERSQTKNAPPTYKPPPPTLDELVDKALIGKCVEAAEKTGLTAKLLKLIVINLLGTQEYVYERRGMKDPGYGRLSEKAFDKVWGKLTPAKMAGLLLEAAVLDRSYANGDGVEEICEELGVDEKKVRAEVERANLIAWAEKGGTFAGKGPTGTKYIVSPDKKEFVLELVAIGDKPGTTRTDGFYKTVDVAKARALELEAAFAKKPAPAKKAAKK